MTAAESISDDDRFLELSDRHADQIDLLLNMISLSRLGGIATVECNDVGLRERLFKLFERRLLRRNIYLYPVEVSDTDLNLVRYLRNLTDKSGFKDLELVGRYSSIVLFVYGIEKYSEAQQEKFLQFLNVFRDGTTIIRQPIVIWASGDFIARMARATPDFWTWKGVTFQFDAETGGRLLDAPQLQGFRRYVRALLRNPDFAIPGALYVPLRTSLLELGSNDARPRRTHLPALLQGKRGARIAVIGAPGAGKTTLLRVLTYRHACRAWEQLGRNGIEPRVPLFVKVNRLRPGLTIERLIFETLRQHELDELEDIEALTRLLVGDGEETAWGERAPHLLLLLDGLNEIPEAERHSISAFLSRLSSRHAIVISCRAGAYTPLAGFKTVRLEPLDEPLIERYTIRYLGGNLGRKLARKVTADRRLSELARNPLDLMLLTQIEDELLPTTRENLLQKFTDYALARTESRWWRIFGRSKSPVPLPISKRVLAYLGFEMQREGRSTLPLDQALSLIRAVASGRLVGASPGDICETLLFSGLVRLSGGRQDVEFLHLTIRDYYAAIHRHVGLPI